MKSSSPFRRNSRSDSMFFGLTATTWFTFFVASGCTATTPASHLGLFAIGAGLVSFLILHFFGYFEGLRLLPRKSDVLLVMFAIPVGGLVQHEVYKFLFDDFVSPLRSMIFWTPLLALVIFGSHYFHLRLGLKRKCRKVVLDISERERRSVIKVLQELGYSECLQFLSPSELKEYLLQGRKREIDFIIISREGSQRFDEDAHMIRAHLGGVPIVDFGKLMTQMTGRIRLEDTDLWAYVLEATPQTDVLRGFRRLKELLEPVAALILGLIFAPLLVVFAILIKLTSKGPVFYRQVRTGYLGRNFVLVKFRSMYVNAEDAGPQWASFNDSRVTGLGQFMRRTRMDELPQLWNVFRGDMSFVGPRPERPEIYQQLKEDVPLFSMRKIVRPGVTGWAQVCAGYAASVEESKTKLEYDLYYIKHMSLRLDLIILAKTVKVALFGAEKEEWKAPVAAPKVEVQRAVG